MFRPVPLHDGVSRFRSAVEEEIHGGHVALESFVNLLVGGVLVILKRQRDSCLLKQGLVEVVSTVRSRDVEVSSDCLAEISNEFPLAPLDIQVAALDDLRVYPELFEEVTSRFVCQVDEVRPLLVVNVLEVVGVIVEVRRSRVVELQGLPMVLPPAVFVGDLKRLDLEVLQSAARVDGYGEPGPAVLGSDSISIDEAVLLELYIVENDVDITDRDPVEVAEPGQVVGLVDGDDQSNPPLCR